MKTIYALVFSLLFTTMIQAQCLEQLVPPVSADWAAAHFLSADQGWITGEGGQLLQTLNGGQSWTIADSRTNVNLRGLTFLGPAMGWAVGEAGVIRRTNDGGISWQQQYSPVGAALNSVDFRFSNLGLIAGDCGTLLRTTNGGTTWNWVDAGIPNNLNVIRWVSTQTVLTAGEGGVLLRSNNGGQTWSSSGNTGTGDHQALEVQGNEAWLSGEGGTYYSNNAGLSWEWLDNRPFYALAADGNGVVVGAGRNGLVAVSTDNGQSWDDLDLLQGVDWSAVALTGARSGYLAGTNGTVVAFRWINAAASGPNAVCAGEVVQFNAEAVPGNPSYLWEGPNGIIGTGSSVSLLPANIGENWYVLSVEEEGCIAQDSLLVQVFPAPEVNLGEDISLCEGETVLLTGPANVASYSWSDGSGNAQLEVATTGIYGLTVENTFGCTDSDVVTVEVQENGTFLLDTLLCSGESLEVNGNIYDEFNPGGTEVLPGAASNGCDSLISVHIEYSVTEPVTLDTAVCTTAFPFEYANIVVDSPGNYFAQTLNADGCPQMIFLNVQELQSYTISFEDSFCAGGLYVWNQLVLTNPGTYTQEFMATDGCDSTVTLLLTETSPVETNLEMLVCQGEMVTVGNQEFSTTGSYEVELTGANGCDSIVHLALTVLPNDQETEAAEICAGDFYTWEGAMLSNPGQYQVAYTNTQGCDSIRVLNLTVFPNPELFIVDTLPDNGTGNGAAVLDVLQGQPPYSVSWSNGGMGLVQTGLDAGNYTVTVTDANDCSDTLSVTVPMTTSLREADLQMVSVWPNPTTGQLWVELPDAWDVGSVLLILYNALGEGIRVWEGQEVLQALDMAAPNGAYLLMIQYREYRQMQKVIIAD
jgi:photosystem II stability/assembly factor-like uncharacterized protein